MVRQNLQLIDWVRIMAFNVSFGSFHFYLSIFLDVQQASGQQNLAVLPFCHQNDSLCDIGNNTMTTQSNPNEQGGDDDVEIVGVFKIDNITEMFADNRFVAPIIVKSEFIADDRECVRYFDGNDIIELFFQRNGLARPVIIKTEADISTNENDSVSGSMTFTKLDDGRMFRVDGSEIPIADFVINQLESLNTNENHEDADAKFLTILLVYCVHENLKEGKWSSSIKKLIRRLFEYRTKNDSPRMSRFDFLIKMVWSSAQDVYSKLNGKK